MIYFQSKTDTSFPFAPYRGGAPSIRTCWSSQIDFSFGHVRNGSLKAYAVMAKSRWAAPEIPKGTPTAVRAALADATVRRRFADQGQDIPAPEQQTPEALAAQQKAEIEKWPIIKAAGLKEE